MTIIKNIVFLFLLFIIGGCLNNSIINSDFENAQKQLDMEFEKYIKKIEISDNEYNKAYDKAMNLWEVPKAEIFVPTSFGDAFIIVCGPQNAEPLVLLHGMNSSSTMWYPNIKELSKHFRVYAIDHLLGLGKSQPNKEINDISEVIDWYGEVLDTLHLEKINLIGASQGGWMAVKIAMAQRSRIKKMALLSPAQTLIWIPLGSDILSNVFFMLNPKREQLRDNLETLSADVENIEQAFIDQYFIGMQQSDFVKFAIDMRPFSDDELHSLSMPVLVLVGDEDIINNEKSIERAKELFPDTEAMILKGAGHFLSIDRADTVNKLIVDFMDENK